LTKIVLFTGEMGLNILDQGLILLKLRQFLYK